MKLARGVVRVGAVVGGLLSLVSAQRGIDTDTDCSSSGGELIITSSETLERLRSCTTGWTGSIQIIWTDDDELSPQLDLSQLPSISLGNLTFNDKRAASKETPAIAIKAGQLSSIDGNLIFTGMPTMAMPSFPGLKTVEYINLTDVHFNETSTFGMETFESLDQAAGMIFMTTTNLMDVGDGWTEPFSMSPTVAPGTPFTFAAWGNSDLQKINIPGFGSSVANIQIEENNPDLSIEFPGLETSTLKLRGANSFTADRLKQIGDAGTNTSDEAAVRKRQSATEGVSDTDESYITGNSFETLSLPSLATIIGPFNISDNPQLTDISLPVLEYSLGEVEISGEQLSTVDVLDGINVQGPLNIRLATTEDCDSIQINSPNYNCAQIAQSSTEGPLGTAGTSSGGDSSTTSGDEDGDNVPGGNKGGLSTGAKAGIGVGIGLGIPLLLLLAFFLSRRRSRSKRATRHRGPDVYATKEHASNSEAATSPPRYSKVPSGTRAEEVRRPVSSIMDGDRYNRVSEEHGVDGGGRGRSMSGGHARNISNHDHATAIELEEQQGERFEMEEQQGLRHEMDARSLPDIDLDDESPERRSLEDIERSRNSGPVVQPQQGPHGPVSPVD